MNCPKCQGSTRLIHELFDPRIIRSWCDACSDFAPMVTISYSKASDLTNQIAHYLTVARGIAVPTDAFDAILELLVSYLDPAQDEA